MHRFFVSHQKALDDNGLMQAKQVIESFLRQFGQPFTLTLARDDFLSRMAQCGGWPDWVIDVAEGIDFAGKQPRFTGYVSVGRILGRISADILRRALAAGKPVMALEFDQAHNARLAPATRVVQVEEANRVKDGWWLE